MISFSEGGWICNGCEKIYKAHNINNKMKRHVLTLHLENNQSIKRGKNRKWKLSKGKDVFFFIHFFLKFFMASNMEYMEQLFSAFQKLIMSGIRGSSLQLVANGCTLLVFPSPLLRFWTVWRLNWFGLCAKRVLIVRSWYPRAPERTASFDRK